MRTVDLATCSQGGILRALMDVAKVDGAGLRMRSGWTARTLNRRLSGETELRVVDILEAARALGLDLTLTISRRGTA